MKYKCPVYCSRCENREFIMNDDGNIFHARCKILGDRCPDYGGLCPLVTKNKIPLTMKQFEILENIILSIQLKGFPPTMMELSEIFNITKKAIHDQLKAIERKGYIQLHGSPRAISLVDYKITVGLI